MGVTVINFVVTHLCSVLLKSNCPKGLIIPQIVGKYIFFKYVLVGCIILLLIIFEGEMLIITLLTSLLSIFCKIILNFRIIVKSIIDPVGNFKNS